jgi:hypothetical protein
MGRADDAQSAILKDLTAFNRPTLTRPCPEAAFSIDPQRNIDFEISNSAI